MEVRTLIQSKLSPNQIPSLSKPDETPVPEAPKKSYILSELRAENFPELPSGYPEDPRDSYTPSELPPPTNFLAPTLMGAAIGAGIGIFAGSGSVIAAAGPGVVGTVGAACISPGAMAIGGIAGCVLGTMTAFFIAIHLDMEDRADGANK